jgi:outer membrane immunogenic protein
VALHKLFSGAAAFAVATLALSTAMAADLPLRKEAPMYVPPMVPTYNWTGFYLGANLGVSFSNGSSNLVGSPLFLALANTVGIPSSGYGNNTAGFFGGAQAGYNWQLNQAVVLGAETDFQWMSANPHGSVTTVGVLPLTAVTTDVSARMNWLGTTRLRLGFVPIDRYMIYVTGGLAYGGGSWNASVVGTGAAGTDSWVGSNNASRVGWTIGGGSEYAITNNISIKGEYLYYNLGKATTTAAFTGADYPGTNAIVSTQVEGSIVRAGINYKF